jgi:chorismate synthase
LATKRFEADDVEIISGVFNGYTTGRRFAELLKTLIPNLMIMLS